LRLVPVPLAIDGRAKPLDSKMPAVGRRVAGRVAAVSPDVAVLFPASGEQFDQLVDGRIVTFGSPAYESTSSACLDSDTRRLGAGLPAGRAGHGRLPPRPRQRPES
jgi:hypothetical protein